VIVGRCFDLGDLYAVRQGGDEDQAVTSTRRIFLPMKT